jgi:hypothetical protein
MDEKFLSAVFSVHSQKEQIAMYEDAIRRLDPKNNQQPEPLVVHVEDMQQANQIGEYYKSMGYDVYLDGKRF